MLVSFCIAATAVAEYRTSSAFVYFVCICAVNSASVVVEVKGNVLSAVSGVCNVMKCDGGEGRVCRGGMVVYVRAAAEIVGESGIAAGCIC